MPTLLASLLSTPLLSRIRRNHGLEHATIHVLSKQESGIALAGHSDSGGFWLLGEVSTEKVEAAVDQALQRLRAGESQLAIHPNCGTNFVTSGVAAGMAGAFAMLGAGPRSRDKFERFPLAALLATLALILSRPLGYRIQQRITTSGLPGDLEIVAVKSSRRGRIAAHRVVTSG
jgi:hypothetical protein